VVQPLKKHKHVSFCFGLYFYMKLKLHQELYYVTVPVFAKHGHQQVTNQSVGLVLPHEMIAHIYRRGKQEEFLAPAEAPAYWRHVRDRTAWGGQHWADSDTIPLGLHGDEVRFTTQGQKLLGITYNAILADRDHGNIEQRFLFFAMMASEIIRFETLAPVWRVLNWSLECLQTGTHPTTDHEGRPFKSAVRRERAGAPIGARAALVELRGDWQWHWFHFGLSAFWQATRVCIYCQASNVSYSDFTQRAGWRQTHRTHAEFLEECIHEHAKNLVLTYPGFHLRHIKVCSMHSVNLGYVQEALASAMSELLCENWWGLITDPLTQQVALATAYLQFKDFCRERRIACSHPRFTAASLGLSNPTAYPFMHGKAYNLRVVTAWLSTVCVESATQTPTRHCRQRGACVYWLAEYFLRSELAPRRQLTQEQAEAIANALDGTLLNYGELALEASSAGILKWKVLPKFHAMSHLADFVKA
jgi:hypothetical protein